MSILEKIARVCMFAIITIEAIPIIDPPEDAMVDVVAAPVAPPVEDPAAVAPVTTLVVIAAATVDEPLVVAMAALLVADNATTVAPRKPADKLTTSPTTLAAPAVSSLSSLWSSHVSVTGSSTPA